MGSDPEIRVIALCRTRGESDALLGQVGPSILRELRPSFLALYVHDAESRAATSSRARPALFDAALEAVVSEPQLLREQLERIEHVAYRVEQRHLKERARHEPPGHRTPGVVMIAPVFRSAGSSREEFERHWAQQHAPLALKHHAGMWDYRQNLVREAWAEGTPLHDGIAMLGFPTTAAFKEGLYDSPEGREAIVSDSRTFVDLGRVDSALFGEYVLTD
jgi:uncharacterized protein (TIGR02118 family)